MGHSQFDCCCCRQSRGTKQAYIRISESEIADDYPEPLQYDKVSRLPPVCPSCVQTKGGGARLSCQLCNCPAQLRWQLFCRWAMRMRSWC